MLSFTFAGGADFWPGSEDSGGGAMPVAPGHLSLIQVTCTADFGGRPRVLFTATREVYTYCFEIEDMLENILANVLS